MAVESQVSKGARLCHLALFTALAAPVVASSCTSSASKSGDDVASGGRTAGGPGSGEAGAAGEAGSSSGGAPSAGASGMMGSDAGSSGSNTEGGLGGANEGGSGGAPTTPDCESSSECPATEPYCDPTEGVCRGCMADPECPSSVRCDDGLCVECLEAADCANAAAPVCVQGVCQPCTEHSECETSACNVGNGRCVPETGIVYALAAGGVALPCGTSERPCAVLQDAAGQLSANRRTLVLLPSESSFNAGFRLPDIDDLLVVGNDVLIQSAGTFAIDVPGGSATLDAVNLADVVTTAPSDPYAAVTCYRADLRIENSLFSRNAVGIHSSGCQVDVQQSRFIQNQTAILSDCYSTTCTATTAGALTVERTFFEGNTHSITTSADPILIRNNIFARNGYSAYARSVRIFSNTGAPIFAYNTLIENSDNTTPSSCTYVGIFVCNGSAATVVSSNLSYENFPGSGDSGCVDWIYSACDNVANNLFSEAVTATQYPDPSNQIGVDPLLADPLGDDFTPTRGSPALDGGDPAYAPEVDFYGNPRPLGGGADIGAIEGG